MASRLAATCAILALAACSQTMAQTAQQRTTAAVKTIQRLDGGPNGLNAVIAVDPSAMAQARSLDLSQRARGRLFGEPVLLKDNIDLRGMATTAGSLALVGNMAAQDAPLAARLRAAGLVMLGKTNLSEWANFRSPYAISGWSAVAGLTRNPHVLDRSACGSSSGSAAAVAAGYVRFAVGTETDGSVVCPAAMSGVVGLKPTVGLVSRTGIVPISEAQDTAGPITRTVADAAALLTVMAGSDPADPATKEADARKTDYAAGLSPDGLRGRRLGVMTNLTGYSQVTDAAFARAVAVLKSAGAQIVTIEGFKPDPRLGDDEGLVLRTEFKAGVNAYLAKTPPGVAARTLDELIDFNAHTPRETVLFGQETFEASAKAGPLTDPAYLAARARAKRLAGPEGIDRLLADNHVDALIAPSTSPAWRIDSVVGDNFQRSASGLPAVAGYPHLTVPMGLAGGLPVGLAFIGPAWSEARLLAFGYAYEQASHARITPRFKATLEAGNPAFQKNSSSRR